MNLYIEWAAMRWLKEHGADANAALVRKALAECDESPAVAVEREPDTGRLTFEPVPEPYTYHIKHIKPLHESTPPAAAESKQPEAPVICLICGGAIKPDQTIGHEIGDFGRSSFVVHHTKMLDCIRSLRERMDSK